MTTYIPSLTLPSAVFLSPAVSVLLPVALGTAVGIGTSRKLQWPSPHLRWPWQFIDWRDSASERTTGVAKKRALRVLSLVVRITSSNSPGSIYGHVVGGFDVCDAPGWGSVRNTGCESARTRVVISRGCGSVNCARAYGNVGSDAQELGTPSREKSTVRNARRGRQECL